MKKSILLLSFLSTLAMPLAASATPVQYYADDRQNCYAWDADRNVSFSVDRMKCGLYGNANLNQPLNNSSNSPIKYSNRPDFCRNPPPPSWAGVQYSMYQAYCK